MCGHWYAFVREAATRCVVTIGGPIHCLAAVIYRDQCAHKHTSYVLKYNSLRELLSELGRLFCG